MASPTELWRRPASEPWKTERTPIIGLLAITNRENWPKADSSHCSIFEAVDLIGSALLGENWTKEELLALDWLKPPAEAESEHQSIKAHKAKIAKPELRRHSIKLPSAGPINHVNDYRAELARLDREKKVEQEQCKWEQNLRARERLHTAVNWLADRCRNGELLTFCRFTSGGLLMAMEPHEWNVDYPVYTFLSNGTYNRWFTQSSPPQQFEVYVFLDRNQLQARLANFANVPLTIPDADLSRLSPYVQLAVRLALSKQYFSPSEDDTQPVREAEVEAAWAEAMPDIPFSQTAARAVAKVIGFPDITAIETGKRASREKGVRG